MPLTPTNPPNAQDQFVDAVQGPTNQAQGPAAQNQAQGPAAQNQAQGPAAQAKVQGLAAQGPSNNNAPVGQNVPIQPLLQPAQAQPVPCWSGGACPSGLLSKLDRRRSQNSKVNLK